MCPIFFPMSDKGEKASNSSHLVAPTYKEVVKTIVRCFASVNVTYDYIRAQCQFSMPKGLSVCIIVEIKCMPHVEVKFAVGRIFHSGRMNFEHSMIYKAVSRLSGILRYISPTLESTSRFH